MLPPKDSFVGSTFKLLAQKIQKASASSSFTASMPDADHPSSPKTVAQAILRFCP
jgi:hypothetical protein